LNDDQVKELHSAIHYVCSTSVDLLADSDKFPADWLFKYRWSKGKKNASLTLPNGEKITFLTVGGRTSAVVPSVQKKTGLVTKDVKSEDDSDTQNKSKRKRGTAVKAESDSEASVEEPKAKKAGPKSQAKPIKKDDNEKKPDVDSTTSTGTRRSSRLKK
jgi:formamidopyrimidine-DNA glycosylase